jgi:NNP family nitrate/nitrite transporter-like MFS transporter
MSTFRQAQNQAHPNKTNALMAIIIGVLILIVSLQIWLLTAALNTALDGDRSIIWPTFYGSLALFLGGAGLLQFLPRPLRLTTTVEKAESFPHAAQAWRTLVISFVSLALAFSVWFMWSAIAVKLTSSGFKITADQRFWITAAPVLLGSLLRIPYGLIVSRYGSRNSYVAVTLLMLVPCIGTGLALRDPNSSFGTLLFWASLTGIAGANFATSMATVTLWFPKRLQGTALGINGLGNLGVTIAQFSIPAIIGIAAFGTISGSPLKFTAKSGATQPLWLSNAAFLWIPFILFCTAALWFGTKNFPQAPKTLASQLVAAKRKHTWIISYLYFLTFGAFVAMGASLPLIINEVFAQAPGGAPNPLVYSPFAVLVATVARPLGGWLADKWGAGRVTAVSIALMAVCGFSLSQFLEPASFTGFFLTIMVLCGAAGLGNGSVFKIIPTVMGVEAGPVIGIVSCLGALGGFFPPLLLGWCLKHFGSPAWAYTGMAVFALGCFAANWYYYWRRESPTHC